jgi:hypothetical protein
MSKVHTSESHRKRPHRITIQVDLWPTDDTAELLRYHLALSVKGNVHSRIKAIRSLDGLRTTTISQR